MKKLTVYFLIIFSQTLFSQVNKVINGGFETLDSCVLAMQTPSIWAAAHVNLTSPWDTLKSGGGNGNILHKCFNPNNRCGIPYNLAGGGFQNPHSGDGYAYIVYFKLTPNPAVNWRWYIQQKMVSKLTAGKSYCVTYWASLINYVNYGVDELGAYFDDGSIQSIAWSKEALANPQVKSPSGVFYTDTLNWMKVQGTFIATGSEEYITLGNFRSNAATSYTAIDGASSGISSYFIDDVSVIETNLPAYAGPDIYGIPGNTVYLGRPSEIGLDDACFWYKLPNTTTPIDTVAGITVTVGTTNQAYIVKQDICGVIKYDTVVVYASGVGKEEFGLEKLDLRIYPNPAKELLYVEVNGIKNYEIKILNTLGQTVLQEEVKNEKTSINLKELKSGFYFIELSTNVGVVIKKIVIESSSGER